MSSFFLKQNYYLKNIKSGFRMDHYSDFSKELHIFFSQRRRKVIAKISLIRTYKCMSRTKVWVQYYRCHVLFCLSPKYQCIILLLAYTTNLSGTLLATLTINFGTETHDYLYFCLIHLFLSKQRIKSYRPYINQTESHVPYS